MNREFWWGKHDENGNLKYREKYERTTLK